MFELPTNGIARSTTQHHSRLDIFTDWVEASILFNDNELSRTDIVDVLIECNYYDEQDFADEWVNMAWGEMRRRQKCIGSGSPYIISPNKITRRLSWHEVSAYSFCLVVSLVNNYSGLNKQWQKEFHAGYSDQGEMFELFTMESLQKQFPSWSFYHTGWSRSSTKKLPEIVDEIVKRLGEVKGDLKKWSSPHAKEAGLDLLCYKSFGDNRVGIPVYLLQCASGENWTTKVHTPSLEIWTKVIIFAAKPKKAFATPFAIEDSDFCRYCSLVDGLLLDRYRLLIPYRENTKWISSQLNKRLINWVKPRLDTFPAY